MPDKMTTQHLKEICGNRRNIIANVWLIWNRCGQDTRLFALVRKLLRNKNLCLLSGQKKIYSKVEYLPVFFFSMSSSLAPATKSVTGPWPSTVPTTMISLCDSSITKALIVLTPLWWNDSLLSCRCLDVAAVARSFRKIGDLLVVFKLPGPRNQWCRQVDSLCW